VRVSLFACTGGHVMCVRVLEAGMPQFWLGCSVPVWTAFMGLTTFLKKKYS